VADRWWDSWVPAVAPYAVLLQLFIGGAMSTDEFELVFLRIYKLDPTEWSPEIFEVLDSFFADVDEYCGDDVLRKEVHGLDEQALRERARATLEGLRALAG
jgi:hypothetical protein